MNYEADISANADGPEMAAAGSTLGTEGEYVDAPKRRRTRLIIILALIGLVAAIIAWFVIAGNKEEIAEPEQQLPVVTVVAPGRTTVEGEISATGTLAARRAMPVGVVGEGGRVVTVTVEAGSWVRQGQVLAVIDRSVQTQQAQSAAAQIQVARADAELAQANLNRALKLVEKGFVSQADVDRLTATRDAANARVRVAQASLRELQARNARLNVTAPAAGLVLERNVEPGQTVGAGSQALFTIAKGGEMEMLARLGEVELGRVRAGESALITPVGTEKSFKGRIWQISPVIDAQDRQGTARIALAYAPELRPGGFATAVISSGTTVAPVLPESAIMSDDAGSYVYILDKDNKVVRRNVKLGVVSASGVLVDDGLTGRERVVMRAGGFLNPGETVKPVKAE